MSGYRKSCMCCWVLLCSWFPSNDSCGCPGSFLDHITEIFLSHLVQLRQRKSDSKKPQCYKPLTLSSAAAKSCLPLGVSARRLRSLMEFSRISESSSSSKSSSCCRTLGLRTAYLPLVITAILLKNKVLNHHLLYSKMLFHLIRAARA